MENDHEKIELLNYDTSLHGESTIRKGMVPGVQKCIFFFFRSPPMLRNINLKLLRAALQPKIYAFSNGHYEGPRDFLDQSLLT